MAALVTVCAGALAATAPGATAAGGGACQLTNGQAKTSPAVTLGMTPTTYSFHGTLSGCQGAPGAPASGTVSIGEPVTINGVAYKAPAPATGTLACQFSATSGTAIVAWNGGGVTVFSFSEAGSWAAAHEYNGSVQPGIDLTRVQPDATGKPVVDRIGTTVFGGGSVAGATQVSGVDASACSGAGAATAGASGALAFYTGS